MLDPNREALITVARGLGEWCDKCVFVGGATVGLFLTDPAAPTPRPTKDIDVIAQLETTARYYAALDALRTRGFKNPTETDLPICALSFDGIRVDLMPISPSVLGFSNRWYPGAVTNATKLEIGGCTLRVVSPPYFIATKLEAFRSRGGGDYYGSHDLEDIVAVFDGRGQISEEIIAADDEVMNFISSEVAQLLVSAP